ncbi:unnamed protein product [Gulo gulo]|uniref:Uncharacterized protein n=1 Tax=Gulo gulo TaxID=48420 RepID=A0A9X9M2K2_GULGU|nr:unnamed protein product [Gulo gulo]
MSVLRPASPDCSHHLLLFLTLHWPGPFWNRTSLWVLPSCLMGPDVLMYSMKFRKMLKHPNDSECLYHSPTIFIGLS